MLKIILQEKLWRSERHWDGSE